MTPIDRLEVAAYRVPTDQSESDGTLQWDQTDLVVVHVAADDSMGLGWSDASQAGA